MIARDRDRLHRCRDVRLERRLLRAMLNSSSWISEAVSADDEAVGDKFREPEVQAQFGGAKSSDEAVDAGVEVPLAAADKPNKRGLLDFLGGEKDR